jgi:isopentenyldiphosphate isomerase
MSKHELLDVLRPNGELTGQLADKAIIHDQGLWHRDVHVWVTNGFDLLQQQRSWSKSIMPGEWDVSVGGHVGAGESYLDAARRETAEELNLERASELFIPAGVLAVDMAMGPTGWRHRTVGDNFVLVERDLRLGDVVKQEGEVIGARWYNIDQLEADLARPETAKRHASQPPELWALGIAAMRDAVRM